MGEAVNGVRRVGDYCPSAADEYPIGSKVRGILDRDLYEVCSRASGGKTILKNLRTGERDDWDMSPGCWEKMPLESRWGFTVGDRVIPKWMTHCDQVRIVTGFEEDDGRLMVLYSRAGADGRIYKDRQEFARLMLWTPPPAEEVEFPVGSVVSLKTSGLVVDVIEISPDDPTQRRIKYRTSGYETYYHVSELETFTQPAEEEASEEEECCHAGPGPTCKPRIAVKTVIDYAETNYDSIRELIEEELTCVADCFESLAEALEQDRESRAILRDLLDALDAHEEKETA